MKKATFVVTMALIMVCILTGCGGNTSDKENSEVQQEHVSTENREVENLITENQQLKTEVEKLATENQELKNQLDSLTNEVTKLKEQLASSSAESNQINEEIQVSVLYNGKVITLSPTSKDLDVISNPVDIYQGEYDRNLTLLISGVSVKNVYVNQSEKIEEITYNETESVYSIPYYMNGEGQYTFLIETENGRYYVSVIY